MSERKPGSYLGVDSVALIEGYDRYFRYCHESDQIKKCMATCEEYRHSRNIDYDHHVETMMKEALLKYDALAKWIGVKNVVADIRTSMHVVRDVLHQHGNTSVNLPDDADYPEDGVEGDGAFVTFEPFESWQKKVLDKKL